MTKEKQASWAVRNKRGRLLETRQALISASLQLNQIHAYIDTLNYSGESKEVDIFNSRMARFKHHLSEIGNELLAMAGHQNDPTDS